MFPTFLIKDMWSPTGKPVAPLSFADSLRERRDLVVRHPDRNPDHKRSGLKPWLSAVWGNFCRIQQLTQKYFSLKAHLNPKLCIKITQGFIKEKDLGLTDDKLAVSFKR